MRAVMLNLMIGKWGDEKTAIKSVIKFKRDVYKSILKEFKDVLDGLIHN